MKKKIIIVISLLLILAIVMIGCASSGGKVSKEKANLNALLNDLYGSDAIVYTSKSNVAFQLTADYVNEFEHTIKAVQLNTTPQEEDFYKGELFSCFPTKEVYAKGDNIEIKVASNNSNQTSGGAMYRLDMLADGIWYAVNRIHTWPTMQYDWNEGTEKSYGINEHSLYRFSPMQFDVKTGLITWGAKDNSPIQLPEGTYRFSTWVHDEVTGDSYQLACQFKVK